MLIETPRLMIRDLRTEDKLPFTQMAADGSLNDIGFHPDCGQWMAEWIAEAKKLAAGDNPRMDYLAYAIALKRENTVVGSIGCSWYEDLQEIGITYFVGARYREHGYALEAVKAYTSYFFDHYRMTRLIATVREENVPSWKALEKAGFVLTGKRMYQDLNDEEEKLYRFYHMTT